MLPHRLGHLTLGLQLVALFGEITERPGFAGGSVSLGQALRVESLGPLPVGSLCSILAFEDVSSRLLPRSPRLPPAMLSCHDGHFALWDCEPKETRPSLGSLGLGVSVTTEGK